MEVFEETNPQPLDKNSAPVIELDSEGATSAIDRLRALWKRRGLLVRGTALGFVLAIVIAFILPARYSSQVRLMPPDGQSSGGAALLATLSGRTDFGMAADMLGLKSSGAVFVGILGSRTVQDAVVNRLDLRKVYSVRSMERARLELENNTSIAEDRKSGIISITVTDRIPERAAQIAQAYVDELDRTVAQLSTSAARREREFLEKRLEAVKQELDTSSQRLAEYSSTNAAFDPKEQARAMVDSAGRLQAELAGARSDLEGLQQVYAPGNVRIRSGQARIAELERQMKKLEGVASSRTSSQDQAAASASFPSMRELPMVGVGYADRYRRTAIAESVYEILTKQYEIAKVQEAKEIPSVKVLDPPVVGDRKVFPPRLLIMVLGAILSFAVTLVWVVTNSAWEQYDSAAAPKIFLREVVGDLKQTRQLRYLLKRAGNGKQPAADVTK